MNWSVGETETEGVCECVCEVVFPLWYIWDVQCLLIMCCFLEEHICLLTAAFLQLIILFKVRVKDKRRDCG